MSKLQLCYPCAMPFQVSQRWNENHDYYYTNFHENGHNGWDFSVPVGTPIYATHDGTVFFVGTDATGAMSISIDTNTTFDYKGGQSQFRTIYGHLSAFKVNANDKVKKGQLIALSGNTGRYTSGPHLHFGVHPIANFQDTEKDNGWNGAVDPALFWDGTYPVTVTQQVDQDVVDFIIALNKYQVAKGIKPYPKIGPMTTLQLKKDNLL